MRKIIVRMLGSVREKCLIGFVEKEQVKVLCFSGGYIIYSGVIESDVQL